MDVLEHAVQLLGGVGRLARALGLRQSAVSNWKLRGTVVPAEHCVLIEQATSRAIRRWDLRPLDWYRIWPELIDIEGAPDVPEPTTTTKPGALDEATA